MRSLPVVNESISVFPRLLATDSNLPTPSYDYPTENVGVGYPDRLFVAGFSCLLV